MRASPLVLAAALVAGSCGAPPPRPALASGAPVSIAYPVAGGGEIRFTVRPRYAEGGPVSVDLDLRAGSAEIRGPVGGMVATSELESGEQVVRRLGPGELPETAVPPGGRAHTTVTWDGRSDAGLPVPPRTYALALDFTVGGAPRRLGTVIEIVSP